MVLNQEMNGAPSLAKEFHPLLMLARVTSRQMILDELFGALFLAVTLGVGEQGRQSKIRGLGAAKTCLRAMLVLACLRYQPVELQG